MSKLSNFGIWLLLLSAVTPAGAQDSPGDLVHQRDRVVAKGTTGAVIDWEEEPWWMALADCAAAFRTDPEDREKVQIFATAAMAQVAKDRGIPAREAGAVVMPYVTAGQGLERADTFIGIFGEVDSLRSRCDAVLVQYRAL